MNITLLCYATFAEKSPECADKFPILSGETVSDVLQRVGIPLAEVKIVFINGISSGLDVQLAEGDRLGVFPAVGGG
ncbi:Sulfur carrier protein ThiS (thiamine biosynthesis) [Maridesulfovibrio ferrireducens]|uniref:Sulfur carrier protein ThiS (Thiamine biosynthesis) n=1 Tax=Maridesulfovibrio ferrireducens TaxID=246191 RepID=A0A1G9E6R0_9BACT|nr:MoaD/ThiS family protein [Maridesulfovibrio ferrireducens]SDK71768.1 Sulfur carrier protein ThiS (thiamine biosynthesis) [Maridesulfovibrio ferrireducens]